MCAVQDQLGLYRSFSKLGVLFFFWRGGCLHNEEHNIWGSTLGSPYFGNLPPYFLPTIMSLSEVVTVSGLGMPAHRVAVVS